MIKTNLPVLLLRGIVLLPNNELRIEFDNDDSKNIVDLSELFHDSKILVVSQDNPLEEKPDIKTLPRIGVVATIKNKLELPSGNIRLTLSSEKRVYINDYLNLEENENLESIVSEIEEQSHNLEDEQIYVRKLKHEIKKYIQMIPYISNSISSTISELEDLSQITDMVVPLLPLDVKRVNEYLNTLDSIKRSEMILEDIYKEEDMYLIEKKIDSKVKNELDKSQRDYLLREKIKTIKEELGDTSIKENELELLRKKVDKLRANKSVKERLENELNRYENLSSSSSEINLTRNYIDCLLSLPWDSSTKDNEDLNSVEQILNESHYGLDKIKDRFIEYLAVKKITNSLNGPIICLVGPPGVGKTSLAFSVAKAMNRNFVKISVGGLNDESELKGHRRTYLGAMPGRIIQSMIKAKSNNPVFLIDEIDKMTKDYKGDPASCLLEILDPEQNKLFSDNYIEEEYDLSNVLFITTANYIEDIPEALRDRLEIIELSGYTEYEKLDITKQHLLSQVTKEHGLTESQLEMSDEVILTIIREYTREAGIRELKRTIEAITRKIVKTLVMNNFKIEKATVTKKDLEKYLGKPKYIQTDKHHTKVGVVNGLAYTKFGGDLLPIEVTFYKGNGSLILTGSLGDVMRESAQIAVSYIKSNYKKLNVNFEKLINNDIHIHVPEGAIPKDGPSAGITLTTAIISAFSNLKISDSLAMTGEITLQGNILPIGGLKEKVLGAYRNGVKSIIIPEENEKDLDEIPVEIKKKIQFIKVKEYLQIFKYLVGDTKNGR